MTASGNITANIRDSSPDQLDIDERTNSIKSRKSNSASATATPEKQRDKAAPAASNGKAKLGSNKKSKEDKKPKPKSKKRKNTAYDSDDSYKASSSESSEPNTSSDEEEEEDQPPPITGPAVTVGMQDPDRIAKFSYPIYSMQNLFYSHDIACTEIGLFKNYHGRFFHVCQDNDHCLIEGTANHRPAEQAWLPRHHCRGADCARRGRDS